MSKREQRIFLSPPHMSGMEKQFIDEAFATNWIAPLGKNVDEFEKEFSRYVGSAGAVALSSGTAAIHLALVLLGVERDDIVFCSSLTFIASANPIIYQGAIPVFIDSEPETWNMSPKALEIAFKTYAEKGKLPKAVIVVNLYGQSADYEKIKKICDYYEVPIVEDAAESLGATYKDKMSGTLGGFGAFSFNGNKIITTSGGGMLVSNNVESLNKARFLATQAKDKAVHYQHSQLGYNYRLSNISAGIGRAQLQVLNSRVQRKREIFNLYQEKLSTVPGINFMLEASYGVSTRWLTTLEISQKECGISVNDLVVYLEESNIESRPVWKPLHLQPIFTGTDYFKHNSDIDISAEIFREGICVPSGTNMTNEDQCLVINQILNFLN